MKVQDTVRTAIDEMRFNLAIDKLRATMNESTGDDPIKAVELLADRYSLGQTERGSILRHFLINGENTTFGMIHAVTRASQDMTDYTKATELERLGGELLATANTSKNSLFGPLPVFRQQRPLELVSSQ